LDRADAVVAPSRAHATALVDSDGPILGLRVVHDATAAPVGQAKGAAFAARHATLEGDLPHDDATAVMPGAGLFVSLSLHEPFGLAVAEAARLGPTLVPSDIPTFRELWEGCALLV